MIVSPCKCECRLEKGVCVACHRTKKEIKNWLKYTDEQRQQISNRVNELRTTIQ